MKKTLITGKKQDIRNFSVGELLLQFENSTALVNHWELALNAKNFDYIANVCNALFDYTPEQLQELKLKFEEEVL